MSLFSPKKQARTGRGSDSTFSHSQQANPFIDDTAGVSDGDESDGNLSYLDDDATPFVFMFLFFLLLSFLIYVFKL